MHTLCFRRLLIAGSLRSTAARDEDRQRQGQGSAPHRTGCLHHWFGDDAASASEQERTQQPRRRSGRRSSCENLTSNARPRTACRRPRIRT